MKFAASALLFFCLISRALADPYDMDAVRDPSTLELEVIKDWKPSQKDPAVRQKLVEVTICEWWPGQKVRLPVTLNAPADGAVCKKIVVANQPLAKRASQPTGVQLELLKKHGVGVVLIGMGTIDAMEPKGQLHLGMKEHLLKCRNPRYSPAWIWGMSQMRALTTAMTEAEVYQPEKVLTTGGSKRGIASAAAGIHDDRFTAIMPVVAPPLGNPGTPSYVIGTEPEELLEIDREFYKSLNDAGIEKALRERADRRAANRVTLEQAQNAGWSEKQIEQITDSMWDVSRVTNYPDRDLETLYIAGTNDSVTPSLLELGKRFPDFPISIIAGGQHGGPATAGYTKRVPQLPEVHDTFLYFARNHFFGTGEVVAPPEIEGRFDRLKKKLSVTARFSGDAIPQTHTLWWNINRSKAWTLPFEYDEWHSVPMQSAGDGIFTASVVCEDVPDRIDYLSQHTYDSLTISSPYRRINFQSAKVALIGDSTVTDSAGWGKAFASGFGENVEVGNFAMGGRSSKSWLAEDRMPKVRDFMPDYMLIQFGHNGQPGKGAKRETDPDTTYKEYLKIYIDEARKTGAIPILLSPVTRRDFTDAGTIRTSINDPSTLNTRPLKDRAVAAKQLAEALGVAFIDLYELSVAHHNKIGPSESDRYSPKEGDITHFNDVGAEAIAGLIIERLKVVEPNLAAFLRKEEN